MTKKEKWIYDYIKDVDLNNIEWVKLNSNELEEFFKKNYYDAIEHEYVCTESDTYKRDMPLGLYYLSFKFINNDYSFLLGIVNNRIGKKTIVSNIMYLENEFLFSGQTNPCTYISSVEVNEYFQNQGIYKKMCEAFITYVDYDQHVVISRESEKGKKCKAFDTLKTTLINNGFQKKVLNDKYLNKSELCDDTCEKERVLQKCKNVRKI